LLCNHNLTHRTRRYFLGAAWAAGMDISSGLFVPMLLIGAVLGRLGGLILVDLFGSDNSATWWLPAADAQWKWIDPGVFAVVGAAGFMGGVTRLTISLAAIMMEVSADLIAWRRCLHAVPAHADQLRMC
jgi:H+/Cl- antiporter ClcA